VSGLPKWIILCPLKSSISRGEFKLQKTTLRRSPRESQSPGKFHGSGAPINDHLLDSNKIRFQPGNHLEPCTQNELRMDLLIDPLRGAKTRLNEPDLNTKILTCAFNCVTHRHICCKYFQTNPFSALVSEFSRYRRLEDFFEGFSALVLLFIFSLVGPGRVASYRIYEPPF